MEIIRTILHLGEIVCGFIFIYYGYQIIKKGK
jgi:hypothetical protein